MAGNIRKALEILPYQLGYVGFCRVAKGNADLAFYRTEDLRRRTAIIEP
jgi:hypothetical protein